MTSTLGQAVGRTPTNAAELDALRRAAWHRHGIASLDVAEIADPWARQIVANIATELFGRRKGDPGNPNS